MKRLDRRADQISLKIILNCESSVNTTFGIVPSVDVSGAASVGSTESSGSYFGGFGVVYYYLALTQVTKPPHTVTQIPVYMSYLSEGYVEGGGGGQAEANFNGTPYLAAGTYKLWLAPSVAYGAFIAAWCSAQPELSWSIYYAECQEVADPRFQFDQADFTGGFNLADYYSFEYSPNLTPEPVLVQREMESCRFR